MVTTQTQIRRDTAANLIAATPVSGELAYDTTNKRITIGDGSTLGGVKIPTGKDEQNQSFTYSTVGGTANAITLTNNSFPVTAYGNGLKLCFKAVSANTTATTINVDGLGVKTLLKLSGGALVALVAGDIVAGAIYTVIYDGTQLQLQSSDIPVIPSTSGSTLLAIATGAAATYDFTAFSGSYNNYVLVIESLAPSGTGNSVDLYLYCSINGGASYDSGAAYSYSLKQSTSDSTNLTITNRNSLNTIPLIADTSNFSAGSRLAGNVNIYNVNNTAWYKFFKAQIIAVNTSSPLIENHDSAMAYYNTSVVNAVRLQFSTGNIAAGTVYLYGLDSAL